ncbi:MAG: hypothetical protein E7B11_28055 [Clostridiales bacterium]|nr:hypothetical protein [Clostridiales bacterium]MDU3244403.1 hypothetical protein [Clostridiales bacterium]
MESYARVKKQEFKQKVVLCFRQAELIAQNVWASKDQQPAKPWDYYPDLFEQEKEEYERIHTRMELETYKERRRIQMDEFNRRREQR